MSIAFDAGIVALFASCLHLVVTRRWEKAHPRIWFGASGSGFSQKADYAILALILLAALLLFVFGRDNPAAGLSSSPECRPCT